MQWLIVDLEIDTHTSTLSGRYQGAARFDLRKRDHRDLLSQRVRLRAGIDHKEMFQLQLRHRDVHGTGGTGGLTVFAFKTVPPSLKGGQKIQFGTRVGSPEIGRTDLKAPGNLIQGESFPRGPQFGMSEQSSLIADLRQGVEKAGVLQEYFGGFDLSFLDVLVPRRSCHTGGGQARQLYDYAVEPCRCAGRVSLFRSTRLKL